jgi:hypothetical protein
VDHSSRTQRAWQYVVAWLLCAVLSYGILLGEFHAETLTLSRDVCLYFYRKDVTIAAFLALFTGPIALAGGLVLSGGLPHGWVWSVSLTECGGR